MHAALVPSVARGVKEFDGAAALELRVRVYKVEDMSESRHRQTEPPAEPPATFRDAHAEAVRSVDLAIGELRRGEPVVVIGAEPSPILVLAAETVSDPALARLIRLAAQGAADGLTPRLALAARRAAALGLCDETAPAVVTVAAADGFGAEAMRSLADPTAPSGAMPPPDQVAVMAAGSAAALAVELARLACLLPAAVLVCLDQLDAEAAPGWADARRLLTVPRDAIVTYGERVATNLSLAGEARVPLAGAEDATVVAFRPADGGAEHLAIVIGQPNRNQPVLTRVHSQCFTGDLLGSLRCDCGDQLRGAIEAISGGGGGVLLYLAQEGRGIGLVNKLRAYALQDGGLDTVDANRQLGFEGDERLYLCAAVMLRQLGIRRVRLMTNNPAKVEALRQCGIAVVERVAHVTSPNRHNAFYLETKSRRSGHLF